MIASNMKTFLLLAIFATASVIGREDHLDSGCVQCPDPVDLSDSEGEAWSGNFSHPVKPHSYIVCLNGTATFEDCPEGNIFDIGTRSCVEHDPDELQLLKSRAANITVSGCPPGLSSTSQTRNPRSRPYYSGSTSTNGPCGQGCYAYQSFTTGFDEHSVCRAERRTCTHPILRRGLSSEYATMIVDAHNRKRNELAGGLAFAKRIGRMLPSASNMVELTWNGELAKTAQAWTDACRVGHDCKNCRKITSDRSSSIGQNGKYVWDYSLDPPSPQHVVDRLWREIHLLNSVDIISRYRHSGAWGHFTQISWADTFQVGCGWTVEAPHSASRGFHPLLGRGWNAHHVTCNYAIGGNILTVPVYEIGSPATRCRYGKNNGPWSFPYLCNPYPNLDPCE